MKEKEVDERSRILLGVKLPMMAISGRAPASDGGQATPENVIEIEDKRM